MKLSKWAVPAVFLLGAQVALAQQVLYLDTFGSSAVRIPSSFVPQTTGGAGNVSFYQFANPAINTSPGHGIYDGSYAVVNPQNVRDTTVGGFRAGNWWSVGAPYDATAPNPLPAGFDVGEFYKNYKDHTGNNGAVLVVNAGNITNDIYRFPATLQPNTTYTASAWILVDQAPTTTYFSIRNADDTTQLVPSPDFAITSRTFVGGNKRNGVAWLQQKFSFTTPTAAACPNNAYQYGVAYVNKNPTAGGNDFFLDDISLVQEAAVIPSAPVLPCSSGVLPVVTALPDVSYTNQGVAVATPVLGNDSVNTAGLSLAISSASIVAQPAHGSVVVDPLTGIITYTPAPGYTGTDTYTYMACTKPSPSYNNVSCSPTPTVVTIHVLGAVANNDVATVASGGAVAIPVTSNDQTTDPTNAALNPASVAPPATGAVTPANGNVSFSNGVANYTPNPGFVGVDTFNYQVCTATPSAPYPQPACAVATVTVTVTPLIVPKPDSGSATSGTPSTAVNNVAIGDMVNGQPATLGTTGNATVAPVGTWPQGIVLDKDTGAVNVPATAQPGTYTMDYLLCDKYTPPNCNPTTVTIVVAGNANGVAPSPDSGTATAGTASTAVPNVTVNDTVNGQPATLGPTGNATVTPVGTWPQGITLDTTTGAVNVPATAQPGTYTMDYTLCDKSTPANCKTATVTITVSPVNNGGGAGPTAVPTMGQWALTGMSLILGLFAAMGIRRRRNS